MKIRNAERIQKLVEDYIKATLLQRVDTGAIAYILVDETTYQEIAKSPDSKQHWKQANPRFMGFEIKSNGEEDRTITIKAITKDVN